MIKLITSTILLLSLIACVSSNKKNDTAKNKVKQNSNINFSKLKQVNTLKFKTSESCSSSSDKFNSYTWNKLVNIANTCLYKKNYKNLISVANFLSTNHNELPFGPYFKSFYFMNKNLNLKALWLIDSAIEKQGDIGIFHYQKSIILNKLKYTGASKESARTAVKLEPDNFGAQLLLGQLELQAGNNKKALEHALKAKELNKNNSNVKTLLADLYFVTGDYKNAITHLGKLKSSKATKNEINFKLAYSFEKLENRAKSIYFYKKIEAIKRSNLLSVYGLDVNDKIKEMEVEVAKLEQKTRQPSNKKDKKNKGGK